MSRFLIQAQIAEIFARGDQELSPDSSGTTVLELEPGYVYENTDPNSGFGVTNAGAFKFPNGNPNPDPIADAGQRTPNGNWLFNGENKRESWHAYLDLGNSLIGTTIANNNINPYPYENPWTLTNYASYEELIDGRVPLLTLLEEELQDLARESDNSIIYNGLVTDTATGNRFVKEDNIYINNLSAFKGLYTGAVRPAPHGFTFGYAPGGEQQYTAEEHFCALRIIIRLYALHNVLYGSELRPLTADFGIVRSDLNIIPKILGNIDAGLKYFQEAIDDYPDVVQAALDAGEEAQQQQLEDLLEDVADNFTYVESLTGTEINAISQRPVYKKYFATTFNEDLITAIPLIQNLYLTEKYFSGIGQAMLPPKRAALSVLLNTINNDDEFQMEPDTSRPASAAAIRYSAGEFDVDAREFILRMLIQTPINILKGLVELIDPHVAITKIIKIGSATAFDQGIEYLNPVAQEIQQSLASATPPVHTNITGQALMEVVLCFIEAGILGPIQTTIENLVPDEVVDTLIEGDYMPSVSLDGIDFTGTIPGMFMIPPSPIGLLYLLLELVMNALEDNDALEEPAPLQEC